MSAAAQNFANLQDYNRRLTEELMSQTRELQESKLRHARLEHQAAEEREQLNEFFVINKNATIENLRSLFMEELNARDRKAEEKNKELEGSFVSKIDALKEQSSILREQLETEKARSARSHESTPRSQRHQFGLVPPPGFEAKFSAQ